MQLVGCQHNSADFNGDDEKASGVNTGCACSWSVADTVVPISTVMMMGPPV